MFGVTTSDDYRPVTWMGRYPVRVTTIIAALYVLGMFATTIAESIHGDMAALSPFIFQSRQFLHGALWQPFTCVLIQSPTFFFLFNLFFFYWSGTEVEKYPASVGMPRYFSLPCRTSKKEKKTGKRMSDSEIKTQVNGCQSAPWRNLT